MRSETLASATAGGKESGPRTPPAPVLRILLYDPDPRAIVPAGHPPSEQRSMRTLILAAMAATSLLAVQDMDKKKEEKKDEKERATRLKPGDAAPAFMVKTCDGKERDLKFFQGEKKDKIVVVSFWS